MRFWDYDKVEYNLADPIFYNFATTSIFESWPLLSAYNLMYRSNFSCDCWVLTGPFHMESAVTKVILLSISAQNLKGGKLLKCLQASQINIVHYITMPIENKVSFHLTLIWVIFSTRLAVALQYTILEMKRAKI